MNVLIICLHHPRCSAIRCLMGNIIDFTETDIDRKLCFFVVSIILVYLLTFFDG